MEDKETQWLRKHYNPAPTDGPAAKKIKFGDILASVPGLPRSVRVLIMRRRQTFENRGRPGLKYHVR